MSCIKYFTRTPNIWLPKISNVTTDFRNLTCKSFFISRHHELSVTSHPRSIEKIHRFKHRLTFNVLFLSRADSLGDPQSAIEIAEARDKRVWHLPQKNGAQPKEGRSIPSRSTASIGGRGKCTASLFSSPLPLRNRIGGSQWRHEFLERAREWDDGALGKKNCVAAVSGGISLHLPLRTFVELGTVADLIKWYCGMRNPYRS